jgi:arylsulfatase A-like enzyme
MKKCFSINYAVCAAILSIGQTLLAAAPQPNIVHILTDDLGWQDIACYYRAIHGEEPIYETPNMDRIAANGMRFMQAYSPAPTCAPSRAAYMAGQYTSNTGVLHVLGGRPTRPYTPQHGHVDPIYPSRLSLDTPTIASVLKAGGYLTAHIQKWHFGGMNKGYPGPIAYGFDFSWKQDRGSHYNDPELWDRADKKRADYEGIWRPMQPHRLGDFPSSRDPKAAYTLDPLDAKNSGTEKTIFCQLLPVLCARPHCDPRPQAFGILLQQDGHPVPRGSGQV